MLKSWVSRISTVSLMASKHSVHPKELPRLFSPPVNRQMKELDRAFFQRDVPLVLANIQDPSYFTILGKQAKEDLLQLQGVSRVVGTSSEKGVLLKHDISTVDQIDEKVSPSTLELFKQAGVTYQPYTLKLNYDYWRAEEILAAILPEELLDEVPCGFTVVGHIAHMNIRDYYLPYKKLIGQVVLDKNPMIKTVVNKIDNIGTVFRTFEMEVLAGEPDFEVEQSESGCRFKFDFDKVYWNSRLHTEHDRLIQKFDRGQAVCDVFAGVGPFAIPAAKKGVIVFANDLNPESYKSLVGNIELNKVQNFAYPYNEDGRAFISNAVKYLSEFQTVRPELEMPPKRISRSNPKPKEIIPVPKFYSHFVMNLPDTALEFLDAFVGMYQDPELRQRIFDGDDIPEEKLPTVHCHCFFKFSPHEEREPTDEEVYETLRTTVSEKLGCKLNDKDLSFHNVRKVAPTKTMYCVSIKLPKEVVLAINVK
jgi:tRNA (guanine37-N1)-methyltransferase